MSSAKFQHQSGTQNLFFNDAKAKQRSISAQKIHNLGPKVSTSQKQLIQKFQQQTQQLKEIKKTISNVSYSRIGNMQRIKVQHFPQQQSINLYRMSPFPKRQTKFTINKNTKIVTNLNLNPKDPIITFNQAYAQPRPIVNELAQNSQNPETAQNKEMPIQTIAINQELLPETKEEPIKKIHIKSSQSSHTPQTNQNGLPLNSIYKKRSLSANASKTIQNLAQVYKNEKNYDSQSHQVLIISSGVNSPMDLKQRYQERLKDSRAKILSSKVKIVEGQTNFKLERKIKENLQLIEKQKTLHELIHTRMEREREKAEHLKRKNEQKRLIHESRKMKVGIQRAYRKQYESKERQFHRSRSEQALLNVVYNRFAKEMDQIKKQQMLAYKLQFLKNLKSVEFRPMAELDEFEFKEMPVFDEE